MRLGPRGAEKILNSDMPQSIYSEKFSIYPFFLVFIRSDTCLVATNFKIFNLRIYFQLHIYIIKYLIDKFKKILTFLTTYFQKLLFKKLFLKK